MLEYNINLNIKLPSLQVNKLKCGIRNNTELNLNLSSNVIGDSNDQVSFLHKLILSDRQVLMLCKALANNSSANTTLCVTQLS